MSVSQNFLQRWSVYSVEARSKNLKIMRYLLYVWNFGSELFLFNVEVNLSRTYSFQEATFSFHMQWSPAVSLQRKAITVYASV